MLKFHKGKISGTEVVVLFPGVCKVNAAIAAQILIDTYGVDLVINAGTTDRMNPELEIFDTVISTEVAYHDVESDILIEFYPWLGSVFFKSDQELLDLTREAIGRIDTKGKVY